MHWYLLIFVFGNYWVGTTDFYTSEGECYKAAQDILQDWAEHDIEKCVCLGVIQARDKTDV